MSQSPDISLNKNALQGNENTALQGDKNQAILGNSNTVFYGNNNQIQFVVPINKKLQQQQRKIPPLLPYLVNRSQQEHELEKSIKKLMQKAPLSPIICIIHGDEFQSHDKFLERLHTVLLPRLLGQDSIKKYYLPSPPKFKNYHEISDYLRNRLAEIVIKRNSASLEEINGFFNKYRNMFYI